MSQVASRRSQGAGRRVQVAGRKVAGHRSQVARSQVGARHASLLRTGEARFAPAYGRSMLRPYSQGWGGGEAWNCSGLPCRKGGVWMANPGPMPSWTARSCFSVTNRAYWDENRLHLEQV